MRPTVRLYGNFNRTLADAVESAATICARMMYRETPPPRDVALRECDGTVRLSINVDLTMLRSTMVSWDKESCNFFSKVDKKKEVFHSFFFYQVRNSSRSPIYARLNYGFAICICHNCKRDCRNGKAVSRVVLMAIVIGIRTLVIVRESLQERARHARAPFKSQFREINMM